MSPGTGTAGEAKRRERLAAELQQRGLDGCLVSAPVNVRYLTGLRSSNAALLVRASGESLLATDSRYAEAAATRCPGVEVITTRAVVARLAARAAGHGGTLGVERHHLTLDAYEALLAALDEAHGPSLEIADLAQAVERLRTQKEPGEVELVERACAVSVAALQGLLERGLAGRTEHTIARDLEARMLVGGADALAFDTIVASGPNGSIPHHSPNERVVQRGDLVTIDFGAQVAGYHADCTRTVLVSGPSADWQLEVYELVRRAQLAGVAALAPGRTVGAIDEAARRVIIDGGYGERFVHGLGHGVGLQIHEPPWLAGGPGQAGTLGPRTTVTVEPGIYLPGLGGVRIEDTTDVGPDGVRVLTDMTTDLITVDN